MPFYGDEIEGKEKEESEHHEKIGKHGLKLVVKGKFNNKLQLWPKALKNILVSNSRSVPTQMVKNEPVISILFSRFKAQET